MNRTPDPHDEQTEAEAAGGARPRAFGFGKRHRLRRKPEFDAIFNQNRSRSDSRLVVYLGEQPVPPDASAGSAAPAAAPTRIGLVVGKRIGHAPTRNRVKRLLREAFRLVRADLPPGLDVVVLPRPDSVAAYTLENLQASLRELVRLPLPTPRPPRPRGRNRRGR